MAQLTLSLLGGFEARVGPGPPFAVPTKKAQALLAYLALSPGQTCPRDKLAALLWAETSPAAARNALRQTLFVVRRALGVAERAMLQVTGDGISLPAGTVETDVAVFEQAVQEGTPAALERAAGLYRGDLLAGLTVAEPLFEEWLMSERERLRELALEALAKLLRHQSEARATEQAVQTALRLVALDPLQEAVHRTLMRLYAREGRRANALRQYQVCIGVLQRELGVEPEPETRQVYQEVLRQRARPAATPEPLVAPLRRSRQGPAQVRREVPSLEPPLVGRGAELARLHRALDEAGGGSGRIAVVLGEAGIGKTRLILFPT